VETHLPTPNPYLLGSKLIYWRVRPSRNQLRSLLENPLRSMIFPAIKLHLLSGFHGTFPLHPLKSIIPLVDASPSCWWFQPTPLKNLSSSVGMTWHSHKIPWFQTTNQLFLMFQRERTIIYGTAHRPITKCHTDAYNMITWVAIGWVLKVCGQKKTLENVDWWEIYWEYTL
jgi:hypothetical protein